MLGAIPDRRDTSPGIGSVDAPLRAEILSPARIANHAHVIASGQHWTAENRPHTTPLIGLVERAASSLEADQAVLSTSVHSGRTVSPAGEWLLDNHYLIDEQILHVRQDLPNRYGTELPRLTVGPYKGFPRLYEALLSLIAHTDSRLSERALMRFVSGYQTVSPLSIGEVWAVPIMLRIGLVENLRRLARATTEILRAEAWADQWAEQLVLTAQDHPERLAQLIARLDSFASHQPVAFFLHIAQRLGELETGGEPVNAWLDSRLTTGGISLAPAYVELQQSRAADQVSIANAITSTRFLNAFDWRGFFERVSRVEAVLRTDPAHVYGAMDFESRDRYRHALEVMARRSKTPEWELAEKVVERARESLYIDPTDEVQSHVGWYLIRGGRFAFERSVGYRPLVRERLYRGPLRRTGLFYWGLLVLVQGVLMAGLAWYALAVGADAWRIACLLVLAAIPLSDIAMMIVNRTSAFVYPPRVLPKLDHLSPVDDAHRTLVVYPFLPGSASDIERVVDNMEVAHLCNRDRNVGFCLLVDVGPTASETVPEDQSITDTALSLIQQLNERRGKRGSRPFHLYVRSRVFSEADQEWMGWERKRGALTELVRDLRGDPDTTFIHVAGDLEFRRSCTFLLTVDADTVLPRDTARRLIATIAHPLNRARYEPGDTRVRYGYGLVQPRVAMLMDSSTSTPFAALHSGVAGIDPYAHAVSDTYQDVFGEGSYTGKGIFEIDVYHAMLDQRFPDNSLLSHDLIEGSFLRTALVCDIEVYDSYPANYLAAARRMHRWARGDWQTVPYLGASVVDAQGTRARNPLSALHKWKIIDNLRRSLVPPTTLLLVFAGWLTLPSDALIWPLLPLGIMVFPVWFLTVDTMLSKPKRVSFRSALYDIGRDLRHDSWRILLDLAALPHRAFVLSDAATRALWRRYVSGRRLLEWQTAAAAEQAAGSDVASFRRQMGGPAIGGIGVLVATCLVEPMRLLAAAPLCALWVAGPYVAWRLSQPQTSGPVPMTDRDELVVRRLARHTWRFFDVFIRDEGNYLPPDNFQEEPGGVVAWRTSPTNMGMGLLAFLSAYDLGYLTVTGLERRCAQSLRTMQRLERLHGHFYNWYDIKTLDPLQPTYISTVDTGNLVGHLIVLAAGLIESTEAPFLGPQLLSGLQDTVRAALESLVEDEGALSGPDEVRSIREALDALERTLAIAEEPQDMGEWSVLCARLTGHADDVAAHARTLEPRPHGGSEASDALGRVRAALDDATGEIREVDSLIKTFAPWAGLVSEAPADALRKPRLAPVLSLNPSLVGLAEGLVDVRDELEQTAAQVDAHPWAAQMLAAMDDARPRAAHLLEQLRARAREAQAIVRETSFKPLYDSHRRLFSIGFNTAEGRLDRSYYDLLASECRLASFLAIAKGDVEQEHWFRLGRALTVTPDGRALVSWSASMFEYLMPTLVMRHWRGTLLDETYATVVARQIGYGKERGVPWGVSESAFYAKDASETYQYQAFGVPGLGLKRGLSEDVVVAPYASALALSLYPREVAANFAALEKAGARGRLGFYEALDFTAGRAPAGRSRGVVKAYFAHHQGMILVAIANVLDGERMQARFHSDPMVSATELLLQERVPRGVQPVSPHVDEVKRVRSVHELPPPVARTYATAATYVPATHFLSNGRYSVMVTSGGGGYSQWQGMSVSRYREDVTRDCWGMFFYVRDVDTGEVFSATHNPIGKEPDSYHVVFAPDKADFRRHDGKLETSVEVAVSPEDDVEVRRLTFQNHGRKPRRLEVTSYFEIAFAEVGADLAHKAFSNLFVQTHPLPHTSAVLFTRRPRSASEKRFWGFHMVTNGPDAQDWSFTTDRAAFIGRLHGVDGPVAETTSGPLDGAHGAVLDPCCAIRRVVDVPAGETARLVFATGCTEEREAAVRLSEKYLDLHSTTRAIDLARTAAQLELRDLGLSPKEAETIERLASRLLLTDPYSPLKTKTPVENGLPMSGLWSIGISGDHPILLVRVDELEHTPLVRQALLAHQYWRHKGLIADLVVLNTRPTGYSDELDERLRLLVRTGHALQLLDRPGGVFLRRSDQMHPDTLTLLLSVARATLEGSAGSIELQLNRRGKRPATPEPFVPTGPPREHRKADRTRPLLLFDNGYGGFDPGTGEYVITVGRGLVTPAPWIDVLANPTFGATVSEAGAGCTWALNSHENRITTWSNDPVTDGTGEAIYIRDEETGEFWSPTLMPAGTGDPYTVRHGFGAVRFEHETRGIDHVLDWFVSRDDPVRMCRLKLRNVGDRTRTLSVTQFVEWVLGDSRSRTQQLVTTWYDVEHEVLTAHNHYSLEFPGRCAFLACDRPLHSWTASRTEFMGRNGRPSAPAAMSAQQLGGASGRFHDNCGAVMTTLAIEPGAETEVTFMLGQTDTLDECRSLIDGLRVPGTVDQELEEVLGFWRGHLGKLRVDTPDDRLDLMVNGWLLYQATACRLWGRTATYQSSGAFGFRDQLQDVLALVNVRPDLVRNQVVEASRHQFREGDVLHWWQPNSGRGVRTRITDDRHWLPLVVAEYILATGDVAVLDEHTPWVEEPPLPEGEEAIYMQPEVSQTAASIYEHCIAALECGRPVGAHGLPLMGGGDWNDGMNRVGLGGTGESVWLAWFLAHVLDRFAPVCELKGETERADEYRAWAATLVAAVEAEGWDGAWYRRAYFDDGTPLGTRGADECRIDAIAQAWAVISGFGDPDRAARALESVEEKLVRNEDGLIALLTPPFDRMAQDPGYIKGYVPGVRENGGQYTHAAAWVVQAHLLQGDGDHGAALLDMVNPISHALDAASADRYKVEPYVAAADVYAVEPHTGRGGWTWYTGSAGLLHRVAVRDLLGFRIEFRDGRQCLTIDPCIPKRWKGFSLTYQHGTAEYHVRVENPRGVNRGVARMMVDGTEVADLWAPLLDDGATHEVSVTLLGG